MLSKEQVLSEVSGGKKSKCIDERDFVRLLSFFPVTSWGTFGFEPKEDAEHTPIEWTRENILSQLEHDLKFAFTKALDKRGLSSQTMHEVILMWMWILEDPLKDYSNYTYYGLPLYKAVAIKYGFENEIGDDDGNEEYYEEG